MPTAFWRLPDVREKLNLLDRSGIATEFFRRNPDYHADYQQTFQKLRHGAADASALRSGLAHRWGLRFCPRSQHARLY